MPVDSVAVRWYEPIAVGSRACILAASTGWVLPLAAFSICLVISPTLLVSNVPPPGTVNLPPVSVLPAIDMAPMPKTPVIAAVIGVTIIDRTIAQRMVTAVYPADLSSGTFISGVAPV